MSMSNGHGSKQSGANYGWILRDAIAGCVIGLVLTSGGASCGGSAAGPGLLIDSNTNWLSRCSAEVPCGGALICLCGMCSQPCAETPECGLLDGATCGASCGEAASVAGMCVLACTSAAECGDGFVCEASECRPAPADVSDQALGDVEVQTPGPCTNAFVSMDSLFARAHSDLATQDTDVQRYARYVSLANRWNAGACAPELEVARTAIGKALNSASVTTSMALPVAIDPDRLLYRVDLRDYAWQRQLVVQGQLYPDAWEAMLADNPYALPFEGPEADVLTAATGTLVPLIRSDVVVEAITRGELYMALIDLPQEVDTLFARLGVDVAGGSTAGAQRAGTTKSRISRGDRIIERQPASSGGAVWLAMDFSGDNPLGDIFTQPIDIAYDLGAVLFSLPNGLPAFALFESDGRFVEDSNLLLDTNQNNFRATTAVSCMSCHTDTIIPVVDEVRNYAQTDPYAYDFEEQAAVERLYPPPERWLELMSADNALYRQVIERLGVQRDAADPVSSTAYLFERDLSVADMAGDLMMPATAFEAEHSKPSAPAIRASTSRAAFGASLHQNLCIALSAAHNRPLGCTLP